MTDLVGWLRNETWRDVHLCDVAADEIERLRELSLNRQRRVEELEDRYDALDGKLERAEAVIYAARGAMNAGHVERAHTILKEYDDDPRTED